MWIHPKTSHLLGQVKDHSPQLEVTKQNKKGYGLNWRNNWKISVSVRTKGFSRRIVVNVPQSLAKEKKKETWLEIIGTRMLTKYVLSGT